MRRGGRFVRSPVVLLVLMGGGGCELSEVTVAQQEPVLIAEIYLRVTEGVPDGLALLHRAVTGASGASTPLLDGARLTLTSVAAPDGGSPREGSSVLFQPAPLDECMDDLLPERTEGSCFRLTGSSAGIIREGATLRAEVELDGRRVLEGSTRIPGDFRILQPATGGACRLAPLTSLPVVWSASPGVWAYVPELEVEGLRRAFEPQGISVEDDPLTLLGLAISESDTTVVLPGGFGVFNRFSGDAELLAALQGGFPSGEIRGRVVVSAADRNTTNWNRGGSFNPSGRIRIPSLFGEGTGVVGSVVNRGFRFQVEEGGSSPSCLP